MIPKICWHRLLGNFSAVTVEATIFAGHECRLLAPNGPSGRLWQCLLIEAKQTLKGWQ